MKRLFNYIFVIIAAMVTFAGCEMSIIDESVAPETKTVQFYANSIETKTAFGTPDGTTYPTLWTKNDQSIQLLLNLDEEYTTDIVEIANDGTTASFTTEVKVSNSVAPYTFYAMSPASAYLGKNAERYSATIPTSQTPLENSVDEAAQILYAVSEEFAEIPNTVNFNFKHFTAYGKLSFVNLELGNAKVTSVAISSTDVDLAGRWNYIVADGTFTENSGDSEITLDTDKTENLWFACAPVGSMNGKKLKFTVNTDNGPISKEVTLSGDKYNFTAGHIANMKLDMQGITFAESKVYELVTDANDLTVDSKIIIVAKDYDFALGTTQNNNNRAQAAVTKKDNTIENPGDGVQVLTVGEGSTVGTLSFSAGEQYLYAPGGGNYLRSTTTLNENASWSVSIADGVATIKANRANKNLMRYNSSNSIFSCYDSGQKDIAIYKLQGSGTVLENYLNVPATIDVEAATTTAQISVKSDLAWTATVSTGASLDVTYGTGDAVVNVTFPENTSAEIKTYAVTFTADGVEKVVTITQAAAEPETPVFSSLEELIAAIEPTTTATKVTVTLTDEEITRIYTTSSGYRNGVFLQVGDKEIEIYCKDVPVAWVVGGTISGTLTDCDWKLYSSTWELCPDDWSELTYTAPAPEGGETTDPEEPVENITISVDFESDTYSEWKVTNMLLKQTGTITAKEGTYYGTTGGKESASIETITTYTSPKSITCYVSKQSNNTNTSSNWNIEVSADGTNWTVVKTQSAASMSKGIWIEFTADLSTYTNVYVRVSYKGSTAIRNIDSLVFTYAN